MAETSIYWDTNATGDGLGGGYTETQMFQLMRSLFSANANLSGVAPDFANKLAVTGTATPVAVDTGAALVYGIPYFNTASVNVAVSTPASATRIDRVVLRASWTAQTVRIALLAGVEGGAAPALTQSGGTTWEISLAQVSITTGGTITVTDERNYLSMVGDLAVTTAKIAADAVTNAKIADDSIDSEHYVDASIDTQHIGLLQITTGLIAADAVTNAKIADDSIDSEHYVDGSIDTAHIANLQITTGLLAADAVTNAKIADDSIDSEHYVDASIDTQHIGLLQITTGLIAADAVDGDKVGDRVAQVHRRQGGSATDWTSNGTTTYTPGAVRIQVGSANFSVSGSSGAVSVTYPVAFSNPPLVFIQRYVDPSSEIQYSISNTSTASTLSVNWISTASETSIYFFWLAIGPE